MEIAFIPNWIIKYISHKCLRQNDFNLLISNSIIVLSFFILKNSLIDDLGHFPHFCLIDKLAGIECPVCGMTRGLCEISKGNINNAYLLNSMSILVAFFFIIQIPLRIISLLKEHTTSVINYISAHFSRIIITLILLKWIINLFINN